MVSLLPDRGTRITDKNPRVFPGRQHAPNSTLPCGTTSTTQKSTSSIHSSQQDTITSNRTNKRRKQNHHKRHNPQFPAQAATTQHNNANNIYTPNSTPQVATNAPPYDHNHPSTPAWGGPTTTLTNTTAQSTHTDHPLLAVYT